MGGAVAETLTVNPCGQCGYDMGHNYIECTTTGECPECGHTFQPEVCEDPYLDDEYVDENEEGQEVYLSQRLDGELPYRSFRLPWGLQWEDVRRWRIRGESIHITFRDGREWHHDMTPGDQWIDGSDSYRVFDTYDHELDDY